MYRIWHGRDARGSVVKLIFYNNISHRRWEGSVRRWSVAGSSEQTRTPSIIIMVIAKQFPQFLLFGTIERTARRESYGVRGGSNETSVSSVLPAWESSSWDNSSSSSSVVSLRIDFIFANLKFQCSFSKVVSMKIRSAHQMHLNLACPQSVIMTTGVLSVRRTVVIGGQNEQIRGKLLSEISRADPSSPPPSIFFKSDSEK